MGIVEERPRDDLNDAVDGQPAGATDGGAPATLPVGHECVGEWLLPSLEDVPGLRVRITTEVTTRLGRPADPEVASSGDVLAGMLLVATELASNALRHGRPPTLVRLWVPSGPGTPEEVIIEAVDHATDRMPQFMEGHDNGGRGMLLARALSLEVSWYTTQESKHVWARVGLVPANS